MANPIVQQITDELFALQKELGQFKSTVDYLNEAKYSVKEAVESVNQAEAFYNQKILELKKTQTEFINLTNSVENVVSKIKTINFPERLDSIEKTVQDTIKFLNETRKATLDELQKASEIITKADFDGRFKKLQTTVETSVKSNELIAHSIDKQKLPEKIDGFEKSVTNFIRVSLNNLQNNIKLIASETVNSIHDLNIPVRFHNLEKNNSEILTAIQDVQIGIEIFEKDFIDKLRESIDKQIITTATFHEKTIQAISAMNENNIKLAKKQQVNTFITWTLIAVSAITIVVIYKLL
jgi:virulence-associated protein VapD